MAIITKEQMMEKIRARLGDATDDETISLIEDVNDTIDDYDTRLQQVGDWKSKYEKNDEEWRRRYRDRFFEGDSKQNYDGEDPVTADKVERTLTYEDLFTTSDRSVERR